MLCTPSLAPPVAVPASRRAPPRRVGMALALVLGPVVLGAAGCFERQLSPVDPCNRAVFSTRISLESVDEVDLLLMIDNSGSMSGEQSLLGLELPRMIRVLASGDQDEDGLQDFTPVRSLHVGIVTSDMGAGPAAPAGETVPSCDRGLGDDGILRTVGVTSMTGCVASYPPVFDFAPPEDPTTFAHDVACVALMGTGGCGFEQQLEAVLKAVAASSPTADYVPASYVPPVFAGGTPGHGDNANTGFIRRNSALALMLVTDEEDCSVPDYSIFYRDARFTSVGLNLRCFTFAADWLYPTQRYIDNFMALRANPALLVYAGIVGIPTDLVGSDAAAYDRALADPRMIETPDTSASPPTRLLAACNTADGGEAFPARRMVEVARGLDARGAGTTIQSICSSDFRPAVNRIIELIADALGGACLPRPLNPAADGTVACNVLELLPSVESGAAVTSCTAVPGATSAGIEVDDLGIARELCTVTQLTRADVLAGGVPGWFYDTSAEVISACGMSYPPGQRISFLDHMPPTGSEVRLSCNQNVLGGGEGTTVAQLGTFCAPGAETPGVSTAENACPGAPVPSRAPGMYLSCDPVTRACTVDCATNADCVEAGLLGFVCDLRPISTVTGDPADGDAPYLTCVNATCN